MKINLKIAIIITILLQFVSVSAQSTYTRSQVDSMLLKAYDNIMIDSISKGLQILNKSLKISIENKYREQEATCHNHYSGLYVKLAPNTEAAAEHLKKSVAIYQDLGMTDRVVVSYINMLYAYRTLNDQNKFDSISKIVNTLLKKNETYYRFYYELAVIFNLEENTKNYSEIDSISNVFLNRINTFEFRSDEAKKNEDHIKGTIQSVIKIYRGVALIELKKNVKEANVLFDEVQKKMKKKELSLYLIYQKKYLFLFIYKKKYYTNYVKNKDSLIKYFKKADSLQSIVLNAQEALNVKSFKHATLNFEQNEKMNNIELININNKNISRLNTLIIILIASALIISSCFILYYRTSNKRITKTLKDKKDVEFKLNSIQKAIASDLHDNFGNRISGILSSSEIVKELIEEKQTGSTQFLKYLGNLNHGVGNLLFDLKDLIWSYEANNESIVKLEKRLDQYTSEFSKDNKIIIDHRSSIYNKKVILPHLWNRQILLTFKEAVNNAYKHAQADTITTSLNLNKSNLLEVIIRDNGVGFTTENVKLSGISNMKKRAESIGCDLYIKTIQGQGTEIILAGEIIHNK